MIICGILADGDVDRMVLSPVIEHRRRQIGVYLRIRAQLGQVAQVDEIVRSQVGVDFADDETVAGQGQGPFQRRCRSASRRWPRSCRCIFPAQPERRPGPVHARHCHRWSSPVPEPGPDTVCGSGRLVETGQFDAGNTQAFFHILGSQARFRLRMMLTLAGTWLIGGKVGTAGNLIDLIKADASQDVVQLAVVLQGREIAQEIDCPAVARLFFQQRINGPADVDHRRLAASRVRAYM